MIEERPTYRIENVRPVSYFNCFSSAEHVLKTEKEVSGNMFSRRYYGSTSASSKMSERGS